jgi:hypothetical protein
VSDKLGFYALVQSQDSKGYLGAILLTDELGKPEEFRVTFPIKPTPLQRQLYGETMLSHIGIELCGVPLFQALKTKPLVLLVNDVRFLSLGSRVSSLIVKVERAGEALKLTTDGGTQSVAVSSLLSSSGRFQPLSIVYPGDYDEQKRRETLNKLGRFFASLDLIEPFGRIDAATKALAAQDERFR